MFDSFSGTTEKKFNIAKQPTYAYKKTISRHRHNQIWWRGGLRKYQNDSTLQFVSYGVVTEGAVNFTIGYLPGGGYEYLNI